MMSIPQEAELFVFMIVAKGRKKEGMSLKEGEKRRWGNNVSPMALTDPAPMNVGEEKRR
jgi:hypothetical protein